MWTDDVEVMDVVAESVHVGPRLDPVAHLEPEVGAALAVAVHRLQPHLHHGLRDGARVAIASAVDDLEFHFATWRASATRRGLTDCCCCCGTPRPSSPETAAGTLLGCK